MAAVVIESFHGMTPRREDGSRWPFLLIAGDNAIGADHNSDLVNALDGSYLDIPEENAKAALLARGAMALSLAAIRQAELLDEHLAGAGSVTEDDLQVILAPRSEPLQLPGAWTHPVQLVGIATDLCPVHRLAGALGQRRAHRSVHRRDTAAESS